jgi:protein associated with RNAse G/E
MTRPGATYVAPYDQVGLVPAVGLPDAERGWLATFHSPGGHVSVYVDVIAPPTWDGPVVTAIDLDLDVVRLADGLVFVDDEDEFAEHQVRYSYPAELIAAARASCDRLQALVGGGHPPYDGSHLVWLERLAALHPDSSAV